MGGLGGVRRGRGIFRWWDLRRKAGMAVDLVRCAGCE
jgi:hypothetical protein